MMDNIESLEAAVLIRGACKSYGNDKILDNLNVTVTKGTIYGLLGASGCGKTTLLGTIVGTRVIQKGIISVLGQPPGVIPTKSIGYMPQEAALLGEFSVKNALQFQGYIFGMTGEQIRERHQFLEELLDLPPANQLVKTLSGGQQRRLSLAMVLVHDPELLILDEPTVGLDPILRQNLWDYLVKLTTEEKKTIIITTHYLEEARQAHTIGLLRNGKILSEGEPEALLDKYNCNTIEGVFALLSRQQERIRIGIEQEHQKNENMPFFDDFKPSPEIKVNKVFFTNKGHAKALLLKNIVRVIRHPGLLIVAFILPILQVSIFFLAIGVVPKDLAIGVVNEELDNYPDCNAYIMDNNFVGGEVLDDNQTCVYSGLGCMFINKLDAVPVKKYFKTEEEAFREMKKGKFHHILHFPRNYSDSVTIVRDESQYFTDDDLDSQQINVYRDVRDLTLGLLIEKELYFTYQRFAEDLAIDCGKNKLAEKLPIIFKEPVFGSYDVTYTDYTAPGMILLIALFLAVGLSLLTITTERTEGMWERTIVSGVKPVEILFFHTIVSCVISLIEFVELFIVSFYVFHVKCEGNVFYVFLLLYSQAVVGICMGTLISVFSRNITEAIFVGLGTFIPLIVISGCVWPLQGMPEILKYISYLTPPTVPIESLRAVLYKGWGITEYAVFKGLLTSLGFSIFYTSLSILMIKFEKK